MYHALYCILLCKVEAIVVFLQELSTSNWDRTQERPTQLTPSECHLEYHQNPSGTSAVNVYESITVMEENPLYHS